MNKLSMREKAYTSIRHWLHNHELPKGTVSSEIQLSQRLDMSRTPVRAALQQLELEGYLRIIPKHGILILESSAQRVGDLLDLIFSMILFSYEQARYSQQRFSLELELEIREISDSLAASDNQLVPENRSKMELRLFKLLISTNRNQEMDRLFEQSVERLDWLANIRRWKAPYQIETTDLLADLLFALSSFSVDLPTRLFAYLQQLKKTWI
ncbi:GntR family transcriptional regulator [Paenibacillus psychroresistens]|uniref:GntR family transcriptional regulator n=1 Tax=Paenibacillus psychroresistens TaxID=1778678 RepID=A0A6B8RS56_9BACL|nr:GntR family transcriptional regulator [Paenibacillus psychroresistens]QGQ98293.1 GntR family transcriptional regulator [Paenibacillus psychroresistens]